MTLYDRFPPTIKVAVCKLLKSSELSFNLRRKEKNAGFNCFKAALIFKYGQYLGLLFKQKSVKE